jgi:hypothetical protein
MPIDPKACVRISAFNWVPPFAQGYVRDLRGFFGSVSARAEKCDTCNTFGVERQAIGD